MWLKLWPAIPALILAFGAHLLWMAYIVEPLHKVALDDKEQAITAECNESKKLTERAANDYAKRIATLNARLASKRVQQSKCVPITSASGNTTGATPAGEPARQNGITAGTLYEYAGEAETQRINFITCKEFVDGIYAK